MSDCEKDMLPADNQYTRLRWILTLAGIVFYVVDVCTDVGVALTYFQERQYLWTGLTLLFVLLGLVPSQLFSFAWHKDDMKDVPMNPEGKATIAGMATGQLVLCHMLGMGLFSRYYQLLKRGHKVVWTTKCCTMEERRKEHHYLFCLATDLSMLKLFETFLESVPQLLLQLYILLGHDERSIVQYVSMAFSFFNIAWALVDYRRCLRRSLPHVREMPCGIPTAIYLLYKLGTITSCILSYSLLLMLSPYATVALTALWLLMTLVTHLLGTDFCTSRGLELLYQAVVGAILVFTFFNVKGQDTCVAMTLYYIFHTSLNMVALGLLALLKPELQTITFMLPVGVVILGGSILGLLCLILYYLLLHPTGKWREADEVDGLGQETENVRRRRNFLKL